MSKRDLFQKQDSNLSKGSLNRQATKSNMSKSLFSKFSNTLFKGQTGDNDDEEILFFAKGQENCIRILTYLLINYDGMEQYLKKQSVLVPINTYSYNKKSYMDLSPFRTELIYYFQILSIRDFHDFYVDFYAAFDKNKNFSLEPTECRLLLDIAMNKCVGPKKFKVFTDICLMEPSQYDNQLNAKIMNEMIENFRDPEKEEKIDYLQLFPYILSFFLERTYTEIKYKQGRIDLMRGTEVIKGREVEIKNITSLVTILREMGIDYLRDKYTTCLTYRDVENVLIKLKNIQKWITFDIIKQIINQLAKLMEVDPKTQNEGKALKLHKIINFLALKLCIHQNCQHLSKQDKDKIKPPSAYLEILVLWNSAMFGQIMKENSLKSQFSKFIDKHYRGVVEFKRPEAIKVLEQFFKKNFQLMPKDQIKNILEWHSEVQGKKIIQTPITTESLINELYGMMCKDGYRKVKEYIRISYEGVEKSNSDRVSQYKKQQGKDFYEDHQINSPPSSEKLNKSPKFDEKSVQSQSKQFEKNQSHKQDSSDSEQEKIDNPKAKLRRVAKVITSQQAFAQQVDQKKDVLKACLIMDSFLKRQNLAYQKMQQSKFNGQGGENRTQSQSVQLDQMEGQSICEQQEFEIRLQNGFDGKKLGQKKDDKKIENEEQKKNDEHEHESQQKKQQQIIRPKIVIKDVRHNYKEGQSNDLLMVAGKLGSNYGPSNFKNAYFTKNNVVQEVSKLQDTTIQVRPQLYQLTDDDFKDEEGKFQVVIDDKQLQKQILIQQNIAKSKKPKDRSTCYYCQIM